jgi:hypothetical protein
LVRNRLIADDGFRANDALRKRRRRNEKCPSNLLCGQAADFTQCERNLSLRWQSGMAAGEDETKAIVLDLLFLRRFLRRFLSRFIDARFNVSRNISLCSVEARPSAHPVNGLEACG